MSSYAHIIFAAVICQILKQNVIFT